MEKQPKRQLKDSINARFIEVVNDLLLPEKELNKTLIAAELGMKPQGLTNIMNGSQGVQIDQLHKFFIAFNVNPDFIFFNSGAKYRSELHQTSPSALSGEYFAGSKSEQPSRVKTHLPSQKPSHKPSHNAQKAGNSGNFATSETAEINAAEGETPYASQLPVRITGFDDFFNTLLSEMAYMRKDIAEIKRVTVPDNTTTKRADLKDIM